MKKNEGKGICAVGRRRHCNEFSVDEKLIVNLCDIGHTMRFLYEGKASQKRILIILGEVGTINQHVLTERLGIRPGSASEVLAKLESSGLIIRTQNCEDHRTADIALTQSGKAAAAEAIQMRRKRHVDMFSCLSPEEKQGFLAILEKLNADWARFRCETSRSEGARRETAGAYKKTPLSRRKREL